MDIFSGKLVQYTAHAIKMAAPLRTKETNSSYLKIRWNFKNRLIIFFITHHVGSVDGKNKLQNQKV